MRLKKFLFFSFLFLGVVIFTQNLLSKENIKFRLLDKKTKDPIANQTLMICSETIKFRMAYSADFKYCKTITQEYPNLPFIKVKTDSEGYFLFDITKFGNTSMSIIIEPEKTYASTRIERSNNLSHQFHPSYIRVCMTDYSGRVISNNLYNTSTKIVEVIPYGGQKEEQKFDSIDLYLDYEETTKK